MNVKKDTCSVRMDFEDNRVLALLIGEHNQNLAHLEQRLDVSLNSFGNSIKIDGKADAIKRTQSVLKNIYLTINKSGAGELDAPMIDDFVRWSKNDPDALFTLNNGGALDTWKKKIVAKTKGQRAYVDLLKANEVVFGLGPAGTGKTYLAVAKAVESFKKRKVERIILARPAVEAGERLGFLPGDMKEKVDPYLRPLYDALYDMMPAEKVDRMLTNGEIEIAPLAFMRGRTLSESYVIIDEAQNTTPIQMKMVLTRLGQNSRMVITGDLSQIDLPHGQPSGLADAVGLLKNVAGVGIIHLSGDDVVRHPVVARILSAYESGQTPKNEPK